MKRQWTWEEIHNLKHNNLYQYKWYLHNELFSAERTVHCWQEDLSSYSKDVLDSCFIPTYHAPYTQAFMFMCFFSQAHTLLHTKLSLLCACITYVI